MGFELSGSSPLWQCGRGVNVKEEGQSACCTCGPA